MTTKAHVDRMSLADAKKILKEMRNPNNIGKPDVQMVRWLEARIQKLTDESKKKPEFGKRRLR